MPKDSGFDPNWKRKAILHAPKEEKKKIVFHAFGLFDSYFSRAAKRRGMSKSAYARRALAAFIAKDLEMPFEDLCGMFPAVVYIQNTSKFVDGMVVSQRDDGQGYGQWQIKELLD
jgi:hypothetical protein